MQLISNKNLIKYCKDSDLDWKSVVEKGVQLLVNDNIATIELKQAIIDATEEFGPYYVMIPNVALLHAKPKSYCLKVGLSVILFDKPILFGDGELKKEARLVFTLSSPNAVDHMSIIRKFGEIMGNQKNIDAILSAKNETELINLIQQGE